MSIVDQKDELRKRMLSMRAALPANKEVVDNIICKRLLDYIKKNDCKIIHCYIPMGSEIDINPLIESLLKESISIVSPKTLHNRKLKHLKLESLDMLEHGLFGTSHPANAEEYKGNYDMIIAPGLAFDHENYRLGYGGGYYDDFLTQHPQTLKIGLFYSFQRADKVPIEKHDVKMDEVIFS